MSAALSYDTLCTAHYTMGTFMVRVVAQITRAMGSIVTFLDVSSLVFVFPVFFRCVGHEMRHEAVAAGAQSFMALDIGGRV